MEKRLSGWKRELLWVHGLIAGLFARAEVRQRSLAYLQGLLAQKRLAAVRVDGRCFPPTPCNTC
jgi:hypothetical protein